MVRVRIAPAPSGDLQLGNIKTALVNYALRIREGGEFILRIDDTNSKKSSQTNIDSILNVFDWLGVYFEESPNIKGTYGPYRQSQRLDIYKSQFNRLQKKGLVYECFCESKSKEFLSNTLPCNCYDKSNLPNSKSKPPAYRLRMEKGRKISFKDLVRGKTNVHTSYISDPIIVRSDGSFTYIFASSIDDMLMDISHVIRGEDLIKTTPIQMFIIDSLERKPPIYGHLPLMLDKDGSKLSKRNQSLSIKSLREQGYHPDAIKAYLLSLGFSDYKKAAQSSIGDLYKSYQLQKLNRASPRFDSNRLRWFNRQRLQYMPLGDYSKILYERLKANGFDIINLNEDLLNMLKSRSNTLEDSINLARLYIPINGVYQYETEAEAQILLDKPKTRSLLKEVYKHLINLSTFDKEDINLVMHNLISKYDIKDKKSTKYFYYAIRAALTGSVSGPDLEIMYSALGKKESLRRLYNAISNE